VKSFVAFVSTGEEFSGYDMVDIIVEKWGVPHDIQIKKEVSCYSDIPLSRLFQSVEFDMIAFIPITGVCRQASGVLECDVEVPRTAVVPPLREGIS
jgi:hypothetical protein